MTWHPSEDDLILHFYGEDSGGDEPRLAAHLVDCAPCRASWMDLSETLKLVDAAAPPPEPGPEFERVMWARVRTALPARPAPWWSMARLLPFLAAGAVVIVAAVAGARTWSPHRTPAPPPVVASRLASATTPSERVLLAALDEHFETMQTLLIELMNAQELEGPQSSAADFSFVRATAGELVSSGRLYRVTARRNGDVQFARILDDLEPVLVDVARSPDRMTPGDLQSLRARIDEASLLFKVRALSNEIRDREKRSAVGE